MVRTTAYLPGTDDEAYRNNSFVLHVGHDCGLVNATRQAKSSLGCLSGEDRAGTRPADQREGDVGEKAALTIEVSVTSGRQAHLRPSGRRIDWPNYRSTGNCSCQSAPGIFSPLILGGATGPWWGGGVGKTIDCRRVRRNCQPGQPSCFHPALSGCATGHSAHGLSCCHFRDMAGI